MALDWCIYTTLLLNGAKGKYINNAKPLCYKQDFLKKFYNV